MASRKQIEGEVRLLAGVLEPRAREFCGAWFFVGVRAGGGSTYELVTPETAEGMGVLEDAILAKAAEIAARRLNGARR